MAKMTRAAQARDMYEAGKRARIVQRWHLQPMALASSTADEPTPPDAPVTNKWLQPTMSTHNTHNYNTQPQLNRQERDDHLSRVAPPRTKAPCQTVPKVDITGAACTALQPLGACANAVSSTVQYLRILLHKFSGASSVDILSVASVAHEAQHRRHGSIALSSEDLSEQNAAKAEVA